MGPTRIRQTGIKGMKYLAQPKITFSNRPAVKITVRDVPKYCRMSRSLFCLPNHNAAGVIVRNNSGYSTV